MADIFISYKREEQRQASRLADALEHQGWSVWWDPQLRAGERFDDVIEEALKGARCVIVMWSRRSVKSIYVKDEAAYALSRNKLVPIKIEEVDLPFRFEGIHTPPLVGWDGLETDPAFQILLRDLTSMLGPPPVAEKRELEAQRKEKEESALKAEQAREEDSVAAVTPPSTAKEDEAHLPESEMATRLANIVTSVVGIAVGWAIGFAAFPSAILAAIDWPPDGVDVGYATSIGAAIVGAIRGAISGGVTGYVLKRLYTSLSFPQLSMITLGWAIGGTIGWWSPTMFPVILDISYSIPGAIGGGVTGFVLKRVYPCLSFLQLGMITLGWAIGGLGSVYVFNFNLGFAINSAIIGAISGAFGGAIMFWVLSRVPPTKRRPARWSPPAASPRRTSDR